MILKPEIASFTLHRLLSGLDLNWSKRHQILLPLPRRNRLVAETSKLTLAGHRLVQEASSRCCINEILEVSSAFNNLLACFFQQRQFGKLHSLVAVPHIVRLKLSFKRVYLLLRIFVSEKVLDDE